MTMLERTLHEHPPSTCWNCGEPLNCTTSYGHQRAPRPGDWTHCITCHCMSVFADDLSLREPTVDELAAATRDPHMQLLRKAMTAAQRDLDAYHDPSCPERNCDKCGRLYTGPAVYCSMLCAVADA